MGANSPKGVMPARLLIIISKPLETTGRKAMGTNSHAAPEECAQCDMPARLLIIGKPSE